MNRLKNMRILIAEDEPFMRNVLQTTLNLEGAWTATCADGGQALELAGRELKFDAVLLDFMMPKVHGLYVLKTIRTGQSGLPYDIPVGLLTGASDKRTVARSMMLDCDAFIVKPLKKDVLLDRIERLRQLGSGRLRDISLYASVDVGSPDNLDTASAPAATAAPSDVCDSDRTDFSAFRAGMVLAEDLKSDRGEVIVPSGTTLTEELLLLLRDLNAIHPLRRVVLRR